MRFLKYRLCQVKCRYIRSNKILLYIIAIEQIIKKFVKFGVIYCLFIYLS